MRVRTHTCTYDTHIAFGSHVKHTQLWDDCKLLRRLSLTLANNGAGQVTVVLFSQRRIMEPEVPQQPQYC